MKDRAKLANGKSSKMMCPAEYAPTDFATFLTDLKAGNVYVDINPNNATDSTAGVSEIGTPLNKANLLTDATAQGFGFDATENPTPNEVFGVINTRYQNYKPLYKLSNTLNDWGVEFRAGTTSPSLTLPSPSSSTVSNEIRYIFVAQSENASFTAPSGYILADRNGYEGLSAGNTIAYTNLITGSIYEISFMILDSTHIGMSTIEWTTA